MLRANVLLALALLGAAPARATTSTLTIQPLGIVTDDSYLREDNPTDNKGNDGALRLKTSSDQADRNTVVRIPLSGLAGRTVLQAWLQLQEAAGQKADPIDARIFPITESWDESAVTWTIRDQILLIETPWTTPGGTHGPYWTDRALVSTSTIGEVVQWQVGPVVEAWNAGLMSNYGLLIEPVRNAPDREVAFNSSDKGGSVQRPSLVIQYTDQPPAIRGGFAEIQPRVVRVGSRGIPLTVWLDVDALGSTPTGNPTGFDALIMTHRGGLSVTGVDHLVVDGTSLPTSLVSWTDDGQAVTFRLPRTRIQGQVRLDLRVDVLAPATDEGLDLPMIIDDSATPGAGGQALWPGNADRVAGNGDDWILHVVTTPPVAIDLVPDSAEVENHVCLPLSVTGRDSIGNVFQVQPDSVTVIPPEAGTVGADLSFCAATVGAARLVAYAGALRDTSRVEIVPEAEIDTVVLLDRAGSATNRLAPGDTMFLDVTLRDSDGLQDVQSLSIDLEHANATGAPGVPAYGASFRWQRGGAPAWTLEQPLGTTWQVVPDLCEFDESSRTTGPAMARLAFVVSRVARASTTGEWTATVAASSATPPSVTTKALSGLDAAPRLSLRALDALGAFSPGAPGGVGLPLRTPSDARLHFEFESNAPFDIQATASDLAGTTVPGDTLRVGPPQNGLHWSFSSDPAAGGLLNATWATLGTRPPQEDESPLGAELHLWIDLPSGVSAQAYAGTLGLRVYAPDVGTAPVTVTPLEASVVTAGLAARLALAEVQPHSVTAGTIAQAVSVYVLPYVQPGDSGVDRILVSVPGGYGTPAVTDVTVVGVPVAFADHSAPGLADVVLGAKLNSSQLVMLQLKADAPAALDSAGSAFVVSYDDQSTGVPPQTATEGDANGQADGNSWTVRVEPGPLAGLVVTPEQAVLFRDSTLTFAAQGQDALGHPLGVTTAWRVEGGIGVIGAATGAFTATMPGTGSVIGQSGAFSDTAAVTVLPPRAIVIHSVSGPSLVYQGESGVVLAARLESTSPDTVRLDTLALRFSRGVSGDANADFQIVAAPPAPIVLAPGAATFLSFTADVALAALTAPVSVQALASGVDEGTGLRLRDPAADSALALNVLAGGVVVSASQNVASVRPGATNVVLLTLSVADQYPEARTLERLTIANRTQGPGERDRLDAELGDVALYRDDGDGVFEADRDTLVQRTISLDGALTFAPLEMSFPPLSTSLLYLVASLPTVLRDGDVLDVELASSADAELDPAVAFRNPWPVGAPGGLTVDGMTAAEIVCAPVGPATFQPGATDRLALDAFLPANGYTPDVLTRLGVINVGTAAPGTDIARLRAWSDDGDGVFSPALDRPLGTLVFTGGDRWQLTGLAEDVPIQGKRVFVTVDAAPLATENTTVKLALPAAPDPGVGMQSGNSGPLDVAVANPGLLTVSAADRVSLVALPVSGGPVHPDARAVPVLHLVATNSYGAPRTLTTLVLADATSGPGTLAERDGELRLLALRADGDGDGVLGGTDVDPVLATGFFQGGVATFAGFEATLQPSVSRQLFVTADLSLTGARDGDVLGVRIAGPDAVDFAEPTTSAAAWPLDSDARWAIDGFTAAQVTNLPAPAVTVGPGDGPALALDVIVPRNGYAADLLRGVRVTNLGSAGPADLALVQLWRDGGDGLFSGAGDDVLLGPLTATGAEWASPLLAEPVAGPGLRLFVSVRIAAAPAESATVRLAIPVGGVQFESANDGPIDTLIAGAGAILVSSAPLLATVEAPRASTVGQPVRVAMIVRNASAETVRGITASALELSGTAALSPVSGPAPASFDLAPAATDTFAWQYAAQGIGEVQFTGSAGGTGDPSNLSRRAPRVSSNVHRVYLAAQALELTPIQTMPLRMNRGQSGVVPFSLTLVHPGGADASDVRVDRLRVRLEEESGAPIVPAALLDSVEVNEGTNVYLARSVLETSGSEMDLALATPATVTGTQPATLSLRLALQAQTSVPTFRVVIDDSTSISAEDATSGAPVGVRLDAGQYPLRSGVASVVAEATRLERTALAQDTVRVGRGSTGATLLRFRLENPGVSGISSDLRLASLAVALTDAAGADQPRPGTLVTELRLQSASQVLARTAVSAADGDTLAMVLAPPLGLPANAPLDVTLVGDIAPSAPFGRCGARLLDSSWVDVRDANTRAPVPVHDSPDTLRGGPVTIEAPAETLCALGRPSLPAAVLIGEANVLALSARLRHPGAPGTARLRVDSLVFECLDDLRRPLAPAACISRLSVRWNGVDLTAVTGLPTSGSRVGVALPGPLLEPGDTACVEVLIDVNAAAPAGFLELAMPVGETMGRDADTGLPAALAAEPGGSLPLRSGLGRLTSPARNLAVGLSSLLPAALAADGRPVPAATLTLRNADAQGAGPILLDHLVVRCSDRAFVALPLGALATRVEAWVDGTRWAESAALAPDSATAFLGAAQDLSVGPGATARVEIRMVTCTGCASAGARLGLDHDDIGVVQPASALLKVSVGPEPGLALPLWTEAGVLSAASLSATYVNFPNPFAAGREATTLSYYMPGPGRVSLRILTPRGETVVTLLDGAPRPAGQQGDRWDGRNGRGDVVYNGVYVAELEVRLDDGTSQRLRRKVAVVR